MFWPPEGVKFNEEDLIDFLRIHDFKFEVDEVMRKIDNDDFELFSFFESD